MTRRAYLYFGATIVLGAILGGVGVYYFMWHTGRIQRPGGFNKDRAVAHLKKELNLSDAQIQQVGQIFDEAAQKRRICRSRLIRSSKRFIWRHARAFGKS